MSREMLSAARFTEKKPPTTTLKPIYSSTACVATPKAMITNGDVGGGEESVRHTEKGREGGT